MIKDLLKLVCFLCFIIYPFEKAFMMEKKIPIIVITDLYHPYQDPGDNMDLIMGFGLPDVELKAVLLDITDAFRKDTADHPTLWKDPRGPREAGIIPIEQLNYIFNRNVPFAIGPLSMMKSEDDKIDFFNNNEPDAILLLFNILNESEEPVEILSFGSARILAVAYNRNPELLKNKIAKIHLSAGTSSKNHELGKDIGANSIPGGEWNVALDPLAFNRILKSDLHVAIYPCAGKDGGFIKDHNNTYWELPDMSFVKQMDIQLQHYLDYAFKMKLQHDFLKAMDKDYSVVIDTDKYPKPFHVWESAIWLKATKRVVIKTSEGKYQLVKDNDEISGEYRIIDNELRPCVLTEIRDDGRFQFEYTDQPTNKEIYFRSNLDENEISLQIIIPVLYKSLQP